MDLRVYYKTLRQIEAGLPEDVVVSSKATPDGGKEGVLTEVPRRIAARLIVEGSAELAKEAEASAFRARAAEAKRLADQRAAAGRLQVTVISEADANKQGAPVNEKRSR